jgi:hypothetical protein
MHCGISVMDICEDFGKNLVKTITFEMEEQNDPPKIKKINTDRKRRATQNGKEK